MGGRALRCQGSLRNVNRPRSSGSDIILPPRDVELESWPPELADDATGPDVEPVCGTSTLAPRHPAGETRRCVSWFRMFVAAQILLFRGGLTSGRTTMDPFDNRPPTSPYGVIRIRARKE